MARPLHCNVVARASGEPKPKKEDLFERQARASVQGHYQFFFGATSPGKKTACARRVLFEPPYESKKKRDLQGPFFFYLKLTAPRPVGS